MNLAPGLTLETLMRFEVASSDTPANLWVIRDEAFDAPRDGRPAIIDLLDVKTDITRQWQYYLRAINYGMPVEKVAAMLGYRRALCNWTGLGDPDDPRANWLTNESTKDAPPEWSKVYTMIRSCVTGVEQGNDVVIDMLDGTKPPPLKEGRVYPQRVEDIRADDYLYLPQTHPHYFFACLNTTDPITGWGGGAVYEWIGNGRLYTFAPHVSRFAVRVDSTMLRRVDAFHWRDVYRLDMATFTGVV